jgi:cytochrome c oxidase subunit 3
MVSIAASAQAEAQTNTGWSNEKFGLVLFIASEAILFGALFAYYFYSRAFSATWPPADFGHPRVPAFPLAFVLTIILLFSGWTAHNAVAAIRRGSQMGMLGWLSLTIALGVLFISGQGYEYFHLVVQEGITPASGIYATTFFALTGLHGLHVLVGIALLVAVYVRGLAGHFSPARAFGLEGTVLYWHFVDLVWVLLYLAVYLI